MTEFLFPDNTVLCNFGCVDRLDLLKVVLSGRGRWMDSVASEARKSARVWPAMETLNGCGWLAEPIEITEPHEILRVERIRRAVFGGREDEPRRHLGEAQSCYVIQNWASFAGSWWISDDRESVRYARRQGITTRETMDLMNIAVVNGEISAGDAYQLMQKMEELGRHLRLPRSVADLMR
jgi:hypothetical protein